MDPLILIMTTSDSRDELEKIATHLVEEKLAACCQISGPINSIYSWQNKTESVTEWVCSIKTDRQLFSGVEKAITDLHHYELPEIIAVEICDASEGYQSWVCRVVRR